MAHVKLSLSKFRRAHGRTRFRRQSARLVTAVYCSAILLVMLALPSTAQALGYWPWDTWAGSSRDATQPDAKLSFAPEFSNEFHWWDSLVGAYRFAYPKLGEKTLYPVDRLKYVRPDALPTESPSYSESREIHPWGEGSFLKHEFVLFRGSVQDILATQMQFSAMQLILWRRPVTEWMAIYGENVLQTYGYPQQNDSRLPTTLERRTMEIRTAAGLEFIHQGRIRLRLPLIVEQKYYRKANGSYEADSHWTHGAWLAPQLAVATGRESELLFTTSTLSFVNGDFSQISLKDGFTTQWYQVLLRTTL